MKTPILKSLVLLILFILPNIGEAQNIYKEKFAHTFSIVARDNLTGEMAVGVQSHWFSVGTIVSWGKSGVGVVATQSFVNPAFGPEGLKLMENGTAAKAAMEQMIEADEGRDFRQLALLDVHGDVATYTGKKCVESAHHIIGDNYSVQANMMLNDKVVPAMAEAFESSSELPLSERIVKVLQAAQEAGGDIRGKQSAVLLVVNGEKTDKPWLDKKVDLRVDDSENPIPELARLLRVHQAYEHMNRGDLAVELNDMTEALKEYGAAEQMFPNNLEMKYWKAVALANNGELKQSLNIFKEVFLADENWREMTKRLPKAGLLTISNTELQQIIEL